MICWCMGLGMRAYAHARYLPIRWIPFVCFPWFCFSFVWSWWLRMWRRNSFPTAKATQKKINQNTEWCCDVWHVFIILVQAAAKRKRNKNVRRTCAAVRSHRFDIFLVNFVCVSCSVTILRWQCQKPIVASRFFIFAVKCQKTSARGSHSLRFLCVQVNHHRSGSKAVLKTIWLFILIARFVVLHLIASYIRYRKWIVARRQLSQ